MRCVLGVEAIVAAIGVGICSTNADVRELLFDGAESAPAAGR